MDKNIFQLKPEFYCDTNSTKEHFIKVINEFINSNDIFLPKWNKHYYIIDEKIVSYCNKNNLTILNDRLLTIDMPHSLRRKEVKCNRRCADICVALDSNKQKIILVKRSLYGDVYPLTIKLGISTLQLIYDTFVAKVISYSCITHKIKEIYLLTSFINKNLNEKFCFFLPNKNYGLKYYSFYREVRNFNNLRFDINTCNLFYNRTYTRLCKENFKLVSSLPATEQVSTFPEIIKILKLIIQEQTHNKDEIKPFFQEGYEMEIEKIINNYKIELNNHD